MRALAGNLPNLTVAVEGAVSVACPEDVVAPKVPRDALVLVPER